VPSKKKKPGKGKKRTRKAKLRLWERLVELRNRLRIRSVAVGLIALLLLVGVGAAFVTLRDEGAPSTAQAAPDKSKGRADAPVTVVVYADFQCPWCRRFTIGAERRLREEYVSQGLVLLIFRNFAFLGDESRWAAEAAECANEQGRFWDYHDKLFEEQSGENVGTFRKENLKRFAAELGLDTEQFNQCLDSGKYSAKVREEAAEGQQKGVRGTPSVFVNGRLIERAIYYEELRAAVEEELKKR
jgi:protein-disulfide isomerase